MVNERLIAPTALARRFGKALASPKPQALRS
jgi:hypothetical protein